MKKITYEIRLHCEIDEYDNVIPVSLNYGVKSVRGKSVVLNFLPSVEKLLMIWIGKYYSYPKIEGKIKEVT